MKNFFRLMLFSMIILGLQTGCSKHYEEKGFAVSPRTDEDEDEEKRRRDGISSDSLVLETTATNVLLTGFPKYRLTTIYKVNFYRDSTTYIGENYYHGSYIENAEADGHAWHYNYMPGLEAVSGYNMVNVSLHNTETKTQKNFFEKPVLMKTLYYPSFSKDTLYHQPVHRNYFFTTVYDADTNKDGFINLKDLRRLYYFDIDASNKRPLIPTNYSVMKSEYDPANDYMYVFARLDEDGDGRTSEREITHVFWIDLKDPSQTGRMY